MMNLPLLFKKQNKTIPTSIISPNSRIGKTSRQMDGQNEGQKDGQMAMQFHRYQKTSGIQSLQIFANDF